MNLTALPIDIHIPEILTKLFNDEHPLILKATPGSGKTTRVPAALLKHILQSKKNDKIFVLLPKRLAVIGACQRVCEENNYRIGKEVGYQVRFDKNWSQETQLIFMTEGVFVKHLQTPDFFNSVKYIIFDEFHERSSLVDILLGLSFEKMTLEQNLKIVCMSATLDTQALETYFSQCTTIDIKAPPFKTEIIYQNKTQRIDCDQLFYSNLLDTTRSALSKSSKDILIFLPGTYEIKKAASTLTPLSSLAKIETLYGSMSLDLQKKVLIKNGSERRIILTTNICESSLTVPDVDCVIDCGLERRASIDSKLDFVKLLTTRISIFSAVQRQGRSSRTQNGYCFKMWSPIDERSMPITKPSEISTSSLFDEIMTLCGLNIRPEHFSWYEKPKIDKINHALSQLQKWQLIDPDHKITPTGRSIISLPLPMTESVLFYNLVQSYPEHTEDICNYFSKYDSISYSDVLNTAKDRSDLQKIIDVPFNFQQEKAYRQLLVCTQSFQKKSINTKNQIPIDHAFFKTYLRVIPSRIIIKKTSTTGQSLSSRGVDFSDLCQTSGCDYLVALSGFEKNDASSFIESCIGVKKDFAEQELECFIYNEVQHHYDPEKKLFYKIEIKKLDQINLSVGPRSYLKSDELSQKWKFFVLENTSDFLLLNSSYNELRKLIDFLYKRQLIKIDYFNSDEEKKKLCLLLTDSTSTFSEFCDFDIKYLISEVISTEDLEKINQLPYFLILPNSKKVFIDYIDPKAPLISAKIQDCFGWLKSPQIMNNTLTVTIQLLAPNMRPTQITRDLENFWKTSYYDIKKELKARYPKHHWPDDPTQI